MDQILLASKSFQLRQSILDQLTEAGFQTWVADNGNEAIALAEVKHPDAIITSMELSHRSAFLVLERLAQTLDYPIPAIVLGHPERIGRRHRNWFRMLGAEVVDANINPAILVQHVKNLLAEHRVREQDPRGVRSQTAVVY